MAFLDVFKIVLVPAIIAFAIYIVGAYLLVPLIRHHRNRYSEYLPLGSISSHTTSLRDRMFNYITTLVVPRRIVMDASDSRRGSASGDEFLFEDADGDRMVGFDVDVGNQQARGARGAGEGRGFENRRHEDV